MIWFVCGLCLGISALWLSNTGKRRQIKLINDEMQLLQQEKQIVVEFMHNMVEAVVETDNRQAMFQRIIHAAILSTGAMSACLFEKVDDNTLQGVAVEGLFPQRKLSNESRDQITTRSKHLESILRSESFRMGEGLIGSVAQSRKALLISDAANDPRVQQHSDPSLQIRSMIVSPVLFRGELIAVLAVANPVDGLAFTDTDYSLVESLAEQVGLAVHNSDALNLQLEKNKLDVDIELASHIQSMLLPKRFQGCCGIDIATHYTPAQKVGGDLYDIFQITPDKIGIAIADVAGKGIAGSLLMAICQTHLHHLSRGVESPAAVLKAINAAIAQRIRKGMFITMIYAVLDTESGELTIARAGHELPLLTQTHANNKTEVSAIRSGGMAIGMAPPELFDPCIEERSIPFPSGSGLLLFTDGVTESTDTKGEEFSNARLMDCLELNGNSGAQTIVDQILQAVGKFSSDGTQADDLTLIAIRHS